MLTKFSVKNFRSFPDEVTIDFCNVRDYKFNKECIQNGAASKVIIYGRNGVGKTNFGKAIMDIAYNLIIGNRAGLTEDSSFLNANSSDDAATFCYWFLFDGDNVVYRYKKADKHTIIYEELVLNGESIFEFDYQKQKFLKCNLSKLGIETIEVNKFIIQPFDEEEHFQKAVFLQWLFANSSLERDSQIGKIIEFATSIRMKNLNQGNNPLIQQMILQMEKSPQELERMEIFFSKMGIDCHFAVRKSADGEAVLYYKFPNKLIRFDQAASSGAKELLKLYSMCFFKTKRPSLIYIDEFDAFYHYEMADQLVQYIKEYFADTQVILTSHNTNLISNRLLRPDCYLILSQDGRLTSLCDATPRELREGHNLEKMYISGEFEDYE